MKQKGLAGLLSRNTTKRMFWSSFKQQAASPATGPAGQAKLLDMDDQLKIDQYRGRIEDFLLEFDKYEEYLGDSGLSGWVSTIKSPELI